MDLEIAINVHTKALEGSILCNLALPTVHGHLMLEGLFAPVVKDLALTWFIRYICY
jgi:hypothetical protein